MYVLGSGVSLRGTQERRIPMTPDTPWSIHRTRTETKTEHEIIVDRITFLRILGEAGREVPEDAEIDMLGVGSFQEELDAEGGEGAHIRITYTIVEAT